MFEWFSQQATLTFLHPWFCDEQVKIFHAGSTETIFRISANYSCWDFWPLSLQIVLDVLSIFNMIYVHWNCFQTRGSLFSFSSSRHQKHPEEALWIQVTGSAFYYYLRSTVKRERFFAQVYFSNETVSQTTVSTGPMKMFRLGHETMNVCQRNVASFVHV